MLDRDDRGSANNTITVERRKITSPFRQETISIRGIVPGEYTVNVHYFLATKGGPVPVIGQGREDQPHGRGRVLRNVHASAAWARRRPRCASGSPPTAASSTSTIATKSLIQLTRNVRRPDDESAAGERAEIAMTTTLLAISAAYVVLAVLLLSVGPDLALRLVGEGQRDRGDVGVLRRSVLRHQGPARLAGRRARCRPASSCCGRAWSSPIPSVSDRGAIYLWVEEVDENNVPSGLPRAYRLPYSVRLADRTLKARDEIMSGNPQEGTAEDVQDEETAQEPNATEMKVGSRTEGGVTTLDLEQFQLLQQAQRVEFKPMQGPILPPKGP